jgi:hypothetical protein
MSERGNGARRYAVHCSGAVTAAIRRAHRKAMRRGQGPALTQALSQIVDRLAMAPLRVGEPLYRLHQLRMQVRTIAVRPIAVDFAVCEDRPLVFIKGIRLLSARG